MSNDEESLALYEKHDDYNQTLYSILSSQITCIIFFISRSFLCLKNENIIMFEE